MLTLAFAGAAFACPVLGGTGWYIDRTGPLDHEYVYWGKDKYDVKYTTYDALYYENKSITKQYKAYSLTPSADQNGKTGHTLSSAADYFAGREGKLEAITRYFQISHFIQNGQTQPNKDFVIYQQFLMLAVWEIINDDTFDVLNGNLKLHGLTAKEKAWFQATQDHYAALYDSSDFKEHNYEFWVLHNPKSNGDWFKNSDMLIFEYDLRAPAVPVPAAAWLMGTGLAGLAALRRRNKA